MLYHNKNDVSERIDVNKTSVSKKCHICHYRYVLDKGFRSQSTVYNGCHDISMIFVEIKNIAILNIDGVDYCCIIFNPVGLLLVIIVELAKVTP